MKRRVLIILFALGCVLGLIAFRATHNQRYEYLERALDRIEASYYLQDRS